MSGAEAESPIPSFWREVAGTYGFALVMFALAVIPFLNWSYSGHGGISWFLVPLCSPWIFLRAVVKIWRSSGATCHWYLRFYKITIPFYVALALPLSWIAATILSLTYGSHFSTWQLFADFVSPFPWWYFS
jgi:hypothetical protein